LGLGRGGGYHSDVASDGLELRTQELAQPRDGGHHVADVGAHAGLQVGALEQQYFGKLPPGVPPAHLDALAGLQSFQSIPAHCLGHSHGTTLGHSHGTTFATKKARCTEYLLPPPNPPPPGRQAIKETGERVANSADGDMQDFDPQS